MSSFQQNDDPTLPPPGDWQRSDSGGWGTRWLSEPASLSSDHCCLFYIFVRNDGVGEV